MALRLKVQTAPFGSFTEINLTTQPLYDFKLSISYEHPHTLSFCAHAPQHTLPLGIRNFILFWDDAAGQSESDPAFAGFLEDCDPGNGSNIVNYMAMDPTQKASKDFNVMSDAWAQGDVSTPTPPSVPAGTFPRIVFNSTIDNDDDYTYSVLLGATVGEIIKQILDDQYQPLYWANAAPGDGSDAGNDVAYVQAELDSLTVVPQEKIVIETEGLRPAIERILQRFQPAFKMIWSPADRRWHFVTIEDPGGTAASVGTISENVLLTLNDWDNDNLVLTWQLNRSLEDRFTAVAIYGPPSVLDTTATTQDGSLTDISDDPLLQNNIATCCDVPGKNRWQITDSTKRRVARTLLNWREVQIHDYGFTWTRSPFLYALYEQVNDGSVVGGIRPGGWRAVPNWQLDSKTGIITTGTTYVNRYNSEPDGGEPNYVNPIEIAFIYARPSTNLKVRYPTSGYEGTAYTAANVQNELQIQDEMLSVGQDANTGVPVTTANREAAFLAIARAYHKQKKDIVYTGGCTLHGIRYDFRFLNRRVNFTSLDGAGNQIVTGFENIRSVLTDVEYDYENSITTLQISSDQSALIGVDPEFMKQQLKANAKLSFITNNVMSMRYVKRSHKIGEKRTPGLGGLGRDHWEQQWINSNYSQWVDEFGNQG